MNNYDKEWVLFGPKIGYSVDDDPVEGLYFIFCAEPEAVKIGVSMNPLNRLSNLRTGTPSHLQLVFYSRLFGTRAEKSLHQLLHCHKRRGEWFDWNSQVQGFSLGVIFSVSGAIQISWPFSGDCDHSMFIEGVDWAHQFLDPDKKSTLESMNGMGGEKAFALFQCWNNVALSRLKEKN